MAFLAYLLVLKKISWDLHGNVFAIFLSSQAAVGVTSNDLAHYVGLIVRDIPFSCLTVLLIQKLALLVTRQRRVFAS